MEKEDKIEIDKVIPSNTALTYLIRVEELHEISAEDAAQTVGDAILDLEKKNFRVSNISPYFDCYHPADMIIKLDILLLKPFLPIELTSMLKLKLDDITKKPLGPITHIYCPPIIKILT